MRRKLLLMPVLAAGLVGLADAQPPAGPGGPPGGMRFGGGPPDAETIWGFVSKGQPTINLNDPANKRTRDRMEKDGTPIPADGILTKDQFKANWDKRMAAGGGQPGGPGQFGGGRGGGDPATQTDDELKQQMRGFGDADGDGRISAAEAASNPRMAGSFATYDRNGDGFIDVAEFRAYRIARNAERQQQGGGMPGGPPQPFLPPQGVPLVPGQPAPPVPGPPANEEPTRPEVQRYGKLPKGAPAWFLAPTNSNKEGLDADRDGQIGLYEWRRAGRKTADFVEMDLNGDNYLTYAEYKAFEERRAEKQKADDPDAAPTPVIISPGNPPAGGRDRGGDRKGPTDRPGKDGKGKRNPFANGNKGGQ